MVACSVVVETSARLFLRALRFHFGMEPDFSWEFHLDLFAQDYGEADKFDWGVRFELGPILGLARN
jgi:hypothetical protein